MASIEVKKNQKNNNEQEEVSSLNFNCLRNEISQSAFIASRLGTKFTIYSKTTPIPKRGFLFTRILRASRNDTKPLNDLGAYFSFSGFLYTSKKGATSE